MLLLPYGQWSTYCSRHKLVTKDLSSLITLCPNKLCYANGSLFYLVFLTSCSQFNSFPRIYILPVLSSNSQLPNPLYYLLLTGLYSTWYLLNRYLLSPYGGQRGTYSSHH